MNFREDQAEILASLDDSPALLPATAWVSLEGGEIEAENVKTRPGGMAPQIDLGGPSTRADVTVKRLMDDTIAPNLPVIENLTGKGTGWVSYQLKDKNGVKVAGTQIRMTGVLKKVEHGNYDANATNPQWLSLIFSLDVESKLNG